MAFINKFFKIATLVSIIGSMQFDMSDALSKFGVLGGIGSAGCGRPCGLPSPCVVQSPCTPQLPPLPTVDTGE